MLKITVHKTGGEVRLRVEGRLTGPWVGELERVWLAERPSDAGSVAVELTNVTFIGTDGKALLRRMWREGAVLVAHGCCTGHIVDEITGTRPGASSVECGSK